ncbi:MAG: adenosine deaminase [Dorea sp.]|jgi:adenosine deaminase|nr:adenosine deaminase [Dorea sp.]
MKLDELIRLPKIEQHCHLDGSLSRTFVQEKLGREVSESELEVAADCTSLNEYLDKFVLPCSCIEDADGLRRAGYDFISQMKKENVVYTEVRFAPLNPAHESMKLDRVFDSLLEGLEKGKQEFGVEYNVIVCAMRHHSEETNRNMFRAARGFLGAGVCAGDLAGAEALYPMSEFKNLFEEVRKLGLPFTIHAGECGNAANIADAIHVGAGRIGHGIAMGGNPGLQALCREKKIGIEMCPISNLQTRAVESASEYPLREFLNARLAVTINTDNRTVSNTSLSKELEFVQRVYGITDEEIILMMRNAVDTLFADDGVKNRLLRLYEGL